MVKAQIVVLLCATSAIAAEEKCEETCEPEAAIRPETKQEILAGLGLFAVGWSIGMLAQVPVAASPAEAIFVRPIPVFGAIEAGVRADDQWQVRMTLAFSVGVQVVGIVLATTSWALRHEKPDKRYSLRTGALVVNI